jgi:hypothetical protein
MSTKGQKRTYAPQQTARLFDNFIGALLEGQGHVEVERLPALRLMTSSNLVGTEQIERHVSRTRNQNGSGQSVVAAPALLLAPPSIGDVMAEARD